MKGGKKAPLITTYRTQTCYLLVPNSEQFVEAHLRPMNAIFMTGLTWRRRHLAK